MRGPSLCSNAHDPLLLLDVFHSLLRLVAANCKLIGHESQQAHAPTHALRNSHTMLQEALTAV